jgi:hypothetical protein
MLLSKSDLADSGLCALTAWRSAVLAARRDAIEIHREMSLNDKTLEA